MFVRAQAALLISLALLLNACLFSPVINPVVRVMAINKRAAIRGLAVELTKACRKLRLSHFVWRWQSRMGYEGH